jgi:predicted glutamine amidotransferase
MGWFDEEGEVRVVRSGVDATLDPEYGNASRELETDEPSISLIHLRKASDPSTVAVKHAHPFTRDGWIFAHNGGIRGCPLPRGMIDSEYLFHLVLRNIEEADWEGVRDAIEESRKDVLKSCTGHSSLTLFLSDGDFLYAYREVADPGHEDYYTLFHARFHDGWLVSSEPLKMDLGRSSWTPLGNRELGVFGPEGMEILAKS